jgi:RNA polymerase sigma factor (sigma-70 family)
MNRNAFWSRAYKNHFNRLCSRARRLLTNGNTEEAEDVVSEAYLRAIRYVKYPEAIVNLFGYLWMTATRVFIVKRRRENSLNMDSLEGLMRAGRDPKVEPEVFRILESKEFEERMAAGQGPLSPREKQLLVLHLKGHSCDEIAAALGEDARLTRYDLNKVRVKVRYRLKRAKGKSSGR